MHTPEDFTIHQYSDCAKYFVILLKISALIKISEGLGGHYVYTRCGLLDRTCKALVRCCGVNCESRAGKRMQPIGGRT